jgi:hypothetical protein
MAKFTDTIELRILDLDSFKELVDALARWAMEMQLKAGMSAAEHALYFAVVKLDADTSPMQDEMCENCGLPDASKNPYCFCPTEPTQQRTNT